MEGIIKGRLLFSILSNYIVENGRPICIYLLLIENGKLNEGELVCEEKKKYV